jgi:rubrerythrin
MADERDQILPEGETEMALPIPGIATCSKCGYQWPTRTAQPKRCPRCGKWLPFWDKPTSKSPSGSQ